MIKAENLVKFFGTKLAVDGISFSVKKGEVLGFLGPNGAGKSTTMRLITGFLPADRGRVTILDNDLDSNPIEVKQQIGYLPEDAPLYGEMTVDGFLRFIASLRGLRGKAGKDAVDRVIATCMLEPVRFQTIDTLSKGYTHRTCFAQAILHDPKVLILDEPTDGLDPNQKQEVRQLIRRMSAEKAIILSTHILEEVDAVCSRVLIINNGRIVADGVPAELRERAAGASRIHLAVAGPKYQDLQSALRKVNGVKEVTLLEEKGNRTRVLVDTGKPEAREEVLRHVSDLCLQHRWPILEMRAEHGDLLDVFRSCTATTKKQEA